MEREESAVKKRVLSLALALCILWGLLPAGAFAAEDSPRTCVTGCSLEEGHTGDCILHEARYQKTNGGEWFYGTLKDACAGVYAGGRVEVLRDIDPSSPVFIRTALTLTSADPENPCKIVYTNKSEHDPFSISVYADVTMEHLILDGGREEDRTTHTELVGVFSHTLTLGAGAILQNNDNVDTAEGGGGLRVINSAKAIMQTGSVIRKCRGKFGGGAAVASLEATLILDGGTIEDCEAYTGGGIFVQNGGKLLVKGDSSIHGNAAKKTMEGYPGTGGSMSGSGGGIYLKNCQAFQVESGTIADNTAEVAGGGAYVQAARVQLMGGEITRNHAGEFGGGVVTTYATAFMLGDSPKVTGNTSKSGYDNLFLDGVEDDFPKYSTRPVVIATHLSEDASIGVSRWTKPNAAHSYRVVVQPGVGCEITTKDLEKFFSDDPKYVPLIHENQTNQEDPDNGTIVITNADVAFDNQGHGKRPPSQLINNEHKVQKPENLKERGYEFEGWYKEPTHQTEWKFETDEVNTDVKPQVLYAKWKLLYYDIIYDVGEGGENATTNPPEYSVESNDITLQPPTREGYTFIRWELVDEESARLRCAQSVWLRAESTGPDIPHGSIGKKKFVAIWKKNPPYTVTYTDGVGGVAFTDQVTENLADGAATPAFSGGRPRRPGYTFTGWSPEVTETVEGDMVYVAQWRKYTPPPAESGDEDPTPSTPPGLESKDHFAYIVGYPDGTVRPEANITRAEAASIFFRLMTDDFRTEHWATENPFPDVAAGDWYNNAVSTAVRAGLLRGFPDGTFGGDWYVTRGEFAAIAARFLSGETAPDSGFSDLAGHWAREEVDRAVAAGWIKGFPDGTFRPESYITRAEVMTLVNRMLNRIPSPEGMREDMVRWSDNPTGAWYYADVQEATNGHTYERDGGTGPETWTGLTENRDWTELER